MIKYKNVHNFTCNILFLVSGSLLLLAYAGPWLPFFKNLQVVRLWYNSVFFMAPILILKTEGLIKKCNVSFPIMLAVIFLIGIIMVRPYFKKKYRVKTSLKGTYIKELAASLEMFGLSKGRILLESYNERIPERNPESLIGISFYKIALAYHMNKGEFIGGLAPYYTSSLCEVKIFNGTSVIGKPYIVEKRDLLDIIRKYNIAQIVTISDNFSRVAEGICNSFEEIGPFSVFRTNKGGGYSTALSDIEIEVKPGRFKICTNDFAFPKITIKYHIGGSWNCIDAFTGQIITTISGGKEWISFPMTSSCVILEYLHP